MIRGELICYLYLNESNATSMISRMKKTYKAMLTSVLTNDQRTEKS